MLLHIGLLMEPFTAILARIRPRVRVYQQMSAERARALERLAALLALRTIE